MTSEHALARRAGLLYFLFMIVAIIGEFLIPTFVVSGDAAATARNIRAGELIYRLDILTAFVTLIIFLFLVASLHRLLQHVDRTHALRMVLLVSVGVAISLANLFNKLAPLVLLGGADFLSAFTQPQLEALAMGFLRWHSSGAALSLAFWGLWLFPFGILVFRSGLFPRILGVFLMIAGCAYVITSFTALVLPESRGAVSRAMMPFYFGEVPIIFWLLIKGVGRARLPAAEASDTGVSSASEPVPPTGQNKTARSLDVRRLI